MRTHKEPTLLQVLDAVRYAFNVIPNKRLIACPIEEVKCTYDLVKLVEAQLYFRSENKEDGGA